MGLACDCSDDYDSYYMDSTDKNPAKEDCKCGDCGAEIKKDDYILVFDMYESDADYYEEHDEDRPTDDFLMCEKCADIFHSLTELNFCLNIGPGEMKQALVDYKDFVAAADMAIADGT